MIATDFTPVASLLGGALIGAAAVALMAANGRIAGISGFAARLLPPYADNGLAGRFAFVLGIVLAPLLVGLATGSLPVPQIEASAPLLLIGGLLVGFGAVWGNGCTSGHGVCGLARLSPRSLVATSVFMATAIATVFLTRHLI
ncbi:YeeE/YedE family protein [Roseomonas frigidaquae]|uniref:YeeE/YedE family protein n=1 Tax=Falsiroseomonas frigidaquae TaxID=487318 RepID=A0ABX1EZ05_9PROT|nr:YeeE/YedE thiosulfate transporter family protein [Falsiroseomonas frigidaquae]NKE45326.1 YeeE/YedE family protein [Falsiroseomonas frigidaquae]